MTRLDSDSLWGEIRQLYGEQTPARAASQRLNDTEFKEYQEILDAHDVQVKFEERAFKHEYQTRFEVVRKRLIDRAGAKRRNFTRRFFGFDQFDKTSVNIQADRIVRHEHANLLAHLDRKKNDALDALLAKSEYRQNLRDKPLKDFAKAVDRRSGRDRRRSPSR